MYSWNAYDILSYNEFHLEEGISALWVLFWFTKSQKNGTEAKLIDT